MQHFRYYIGVGFMFFLVQLISAQEPKNAQVDSVFQKTLINGISLGIPGISVAIGKGDSIYWSGTVGFSNLEQQIPIKTDTKFGIGSITKTFVAIVALQLAEEGQLNLGEVPSDYLDPSEFQGIANFDKAPIKTLLNHQSGIPSFEFDPRWIQDGRGVSLKPDHIWSKKEPLDYIKNAPALFAPGEDYDYSNTNYTLLGLIIEHITNPLHQEIRQRILEPLRLRDTYLQSFETIPGGYADNYHYPTSDYLKAAGGWNTQFPKINPYLMDTSVSNLSMEWADGGMVASATDLVKWAQALNGSGFLGENLKKQYFTYHPPYSGSDPNFQYAQGIYRIDPYYRNHAFLGHSGGVLGFSAMMFWVEDTDIVIVSLVNVGHMHSGFKRPPSTLFYQSILVPAVFEHFGIGKK